MVEADCPEKQLTMAHNAETILTHSEIEGQMKTRLDNRSGGECLMVSFFWQDKRAMVPVLDREAGYEKAT